MKAFGKFLLRLVVGFAISIGILLAAMLNGFFSGGTGSGGFVLFWIAFIGTIVWAVSAFFVDIPVSRTDFEQYTEEEDEAKTFLGKPQQNAMFCPKCNREISQFSLSCAWCGATTTSHS